MSLRQTLRKAAGLLVELPAEEAEAPATRVYDGTRQAGGATDKMWADLEKEARPAALKTVEQIVRESEGPNLDQIHVPSDPPPPVANPDGSVNYAAIYAAAKLPDSPFTAEQVLEMLAALPTEVPLESRRQMIKVSINAMGKAIGASPENIVADASRKLAALTAYTDNLARLTGEYCRAAESKIASLQAEIESTQKAMAAAREKQERELAACSGESHRLDEVLEFFSLDVAPSAHAPEPTA